MSSLPFVPLYINNERRPSSTGATFPVINTYSNAPVTTSASASPADCIAAIESAQAAFPAWEATSPLARMAVFVRAAGIMETSTWQAKVLAAIEEETASSSYWAGYNGGRAAMSMHMAAAMANELKGETFPSTVPGGYAVVQRRAQGVIYSVVPWNGPIPLTIRGVVIPAICGNTVILRPSEFSPRIQSLVMDAMIEAGLPPGVVNFLPMSAQDTPTLTPIIIGHPYVRTITFTGSDRVGKLIAMEAAKYLKPCVLELGGKAPSVVLADADIAQAARGLVFGGMLNSGQICMSTERVIVERPALEPLLEAIKQATENLATGDPATSQITPLFTETSAGTVVELIREAQEAGAEVIVGDVKKDGALVRPHVVVGAKRGMRLWEKESFGPILSIAVAESVDHAVELANDSEYTLTSALWTKDVHKAMDVARRIRAGSTNINGPTIQSETGLGIAGLGGGSGYGRFDVDHFTDKRILTFHPPERTYSGFLA
ncbi:aldehyde dehydrogenase [Amylostereum chailletii]|nr:aldehyde dehydrogenase [Amylostereum chailletii]